MIKQLIKKIILKYFRYKQKLNRINLTGPVYISKSAKFSFHSKIRIGKYCRIGNYCHLDAEGGINIDDGTILAPMVTILTSSHNYDTNEAIPFANEDILKSVNIGKGVWIGYGVMISPGVTIGDASIIAMGSVVVKDVGPGELVGGNPARVIKVRQNNFAELISKESYYYKHLLDKRLLRNNRDLNAILGQIIK